MADIVLSPLLQVIYDRLASPVIQKLCDCWDLKENFQKLQDLLPMIQALLEDAEEQQVSNKAVRIWISKLKDAADDAEDMLDEFEVKGVIEDSGALELLSFSDDKLRKMLQRLEMTAVEGLKFNLREVARVDRSIDKRETSSFVIESEVYGREEDKEKIVKLLSSCETTQGGDASFIPIIGVGGLGKTTLAQLVYNDVRVDRHFDLKLWIFVSDDFNAKKIMKSAIESATNSTCDFLELDALQSKLWGLLQKKRYLLVLDDVWNEDQDEWDKLRPLFRGGIDGSKIIVTTRSKKVGLLIDGPTFPYYLKGLPENDCWALFKKRAFCRGEEKEYPNLLLIGKNIVKKCGGVPLAAKTLGSLMRLKREEREWLFVQNSEIWNLDACQNGLLSALGLSYFHLPPPLKRCFSFCSIFPKYYEINKEKLIHLWMAEGLIPSVEGSKPPEDIGNEYFNDLLWMSFFQDVDDHNNDGITGYRMHDIIHELARSVAGKGSLILEHGLPASSLSLTRRSSVVCGFKTSTIPEALYEAKHLRTLLLFPGGDFIEAPHKLFSSFKYLRVLDLNGSGLIRLDELIGGLMCLRYLDLSYTHIRVLPDAISKLYFLQTLNLYNCYNLVQLPQLANLTNLRHLILTGCDALTSMLPFDDYQIQRYPRLALLFRVGLPLCNQLQTVPVFIVGGFPDLVLLGLLNLRGELKIKGLENVSSADDAGRAKLAKKENLQSLGLYWGNKDDGLSSYPVVEAKIIKFQKSKKPYPSGPSRSCEPDATLGEEVIKGLQPHPNLKQLFVKGYPGIMFPHWTLPNLIVVDLINFKNCEHLPVLGNLQLLNTLSLSGMEAVMRIGMQFYGGGTKRPFPSLTELVLRGFPNLEEWSSANDDYAFPRLRKVIVNKCPKLTAMPLFQSLQHLELRDCNPMILKSIENLKHLSILAIEKVPELYSLSGRLLARNSLLTSLEIISCPNLCSLPSELGNLTSLKSLIIRWCEELSSLPQGLQNLKALESLEISDCHSIVSLPNDGIGSLSSLRTLSVENCSNLVSLSTSFQHLTSLELLTIMYCPSLPSLPEGVQHLSALRSLSLLSCPDLLSLPEGLQYVTTLQSLEIRSCPGLTVLPEWVENLALLRSLSISDCYNLKCLPKALKVLSALQHLSIQDCPELQKRCKRESGEDWLNIFHIPHIHIGSPEYRQSTTAGSSSSRN